MTPFLAISALSVLIPLVFFFIARPNLPKEYSLIGVYLIATTVAEMYGSYTIIFEKTPNNYFFNLFIILEVTLWLLFFSLQCQNQKIAWFILIIMLCFNFSSYVVYWGNPNGFSVYICAVSCFFIALSGNLVFVEQNISLKPDWLLCGLSLTNLFYFMVCGIYYLIGVSISDSDFEPFRTLFRAWNILYHLALFFFLQTKIPTSAKKWGFLSNYLNVKVPEWFG